LALDGGKWLASHPGNFIPREKTPIPTEEKAGWGPEPVWMWWQGESLWW